MLPRLLAFVAVLLARRTRTPDGAGVVVETRCFGRLLARERYEGRRRHGPALRWWTDGRKRSHGTYRRGRRDGDWFEFAPDGTLDRERTGLYRDGLRIGGIRGFNEWLGSP